jgi:hypothetical protein
MNIFITGASGFVGGAFAKAVAGRHTLTAMSRSEASDAKIRAAGATPVRCTLDDVTAAQMQGADAGVHCAAYVEEWGPWSDYWRINVDGTKRMLAAAKEAGVKRFVHIGTEAALFYGQDMRNVDETTPLALNSPFPYSRTKAHAEKAVREANDPAKEFETIDVRPRFVWGPDDETILPAVKSMAEQGRFAWIGGGRNKTSTTYIGNLSYAIELALTNGKSGEAYFVLDGPPVVFRELLTRMAAAAGFTLRGSRSARMADPGHRLCERKGVADIAAVRPPAAHALHGRHHVLRLHSGRRKGPPRHGLPAALHDGPGHGRAGGIGAEVEFTSPKHPIGEDPEYCRPDPSHRPASRRLGSAFSEAQSWRPRQARA